MKSVRIVGTGSFLPPREVTSEELGDFLQIRDGKWIKKFVGIERRRFTGLLDVEMGTVQCELSDLDMAYRSALSSLKNARLTPEDIGGLIYVTCTQDEEHHDAKFGAASMELHRRLEFSKKTFAYEVDSGCAGIIQGLSVAQAFVLAGRAKTILVVASNNTSSFVDRDLYIKEEAWLSIAIFGDGAASLIVQADETSNGHVEHGIVDIFCGSDSTAHLMDCYRINGKMIYKIRGREVKYYYPILMEAAYEGLQEKLEESDVDFTLKDADLYLFHQANPNILEDLVKKWSLDPEKVLVNVKELGNLSAATIAELLDRAVQEGRIHEGSLVLLCSVGAGGRPGAHFGAALIRW